jgi:hypothetical protein
VSNSFRLAAGLAAAIVLAVVGYNLLPKSGPGPAGPSPTPSAVPTLVPTPSPSAAAYQCEEATGCLGALPGTPQHTSQFEPAFTYSTPAGWFNQIDIPTLVGITPADQPADMILVWSGAVPAEQTASCVLRAKAGAGSTARDWMTYLRSHPGLQVANIRSVKIGGRDAQSIDISGKSSWTSPCADDHADHAVRIVKTPSGAPGDGYGVGGTSAARVYLVDVGGTAVVIILYAYTGGDAALATQVALGEPVVTSFTFDAP